MDGAGQQENGRYKLDHYKGAHPPWNMLPQQHHMKEQSNALVMNKKIMSILAERDAAIREWNIAVSERKEAFAARDEALQQREKALAERDSALIERNNALAVLQYRENALNCPIGSGKSRGSRMHPSYHATDTGGTLDREMHVTDALPVSTIAPAEGKSFPVKRTKVNKAVSSKSPRKIKKVAEDLNRQAGTEVRKCKSEWNDQDIGLNMVSFDATTMPVPICSCTGVARHCYKWGNGGWQSSCCTTTMSSYPLPQMPNKRHARVGGRKMSGSVFTKLLSRLAADGHDLSIPLDLKTYWARHGTNRYIIIK